MDKLVRLSIRITEEQDKQISDDIKKLRIGNHIIPKAEYVREIITKSLSSKIEKTDIIKGTESNDKIKVLEDRILGLISENKNSDKKIKELTDKLEKVKKTERKQEVISQTPTIDDNDDVMTAIKSLKVLVQDMNNTIDTVDDIVDDTKQVVCVHDKKTGMSNKKIEDIADEVHDIKESLSDIVTTMTSPKEYLDLQEIKSMLIVIKDLVEKNRI